MHLKFKATQEQTQCIPQKYSTISLLLLTLNDHIYIFIITISFMV